MHYIQISIPVEDPGTQEVLLAQLSDLSYEGFEQQDQNLQAFLPEDKFDPAALLAVLAPWKLSYSQERLPSRNWNEEWEKNFEPVIIAEFCAIRASFHPPIPDMEQELIITPKMSFGTGHHATTYMMVAAMRNLPLKGKKVLDFGTGTGVLAILAEKMGAEHIVAIDYDAWCIENSLENIQENHCHRIDLRQADSPASDQPFDVILANVNKHVILKELHAMGQQLEKEGVILLSGLLQEDLIDIEKEALANHLGVVERTTRGNWICLKLTKKDQ